MTVRDPGPGAETRRASHHLSTPAPQTQEQVPEFAPAETADVSPHVSGAATGASASPAAPSGSRAASPGLSPRQVLALQRSVGNRAVATIMRSVAQRVPIEPKRSETLYNTNDPSTGKATAGSFGGKSTYEMTRNGDSGVTIIHPHQVPEPVPEQRRPESPRCARQTHHRWASSWVDPTEIPASDPRRAWATDIATGAVAHWNGHLTLVGEEWNLTTDNTKKRLPVTFQSVPVFGLGETEDARIIVHPSVDGRRVTRPAHRRRQLVHEQGRLHR